MSSQVVDTHLVTRYCLLMSRKDFEAIAHTLDANHAPLHLVQDFADMLAESNERFDRKRFILASTHNLRANLVSQDRIIAKELS